MSITVNNPFAGQNMSGSNAWPTSSPGQAVPSTSKPGQVLRLNANGQHVWVDDPNPNAIASVRGIDPMPDTQRSDSTQNLAEELADMRNVISAQAQEIQRLRSEMDEIKALIKDSRSRQLNGAGYWDPA